MFGMKMGLFINCRWFFRDFYGEKSLVGQPKIVWNYCAEIANILNNFVTRLDVFSTLLPVHRPLLVLDYINMMRKLSTIEIGFQISKW